MKPKQLSAIETQKIVLEGTMYVILRESAFAELCLAAGVSPRDDYRYPHDTLDAGIDLDQASMAEKIKRRRQSAGLSQAELASRAGVRPETLNRIERGRTTPDFSTVRKLVIAMNAAERESLNLNLPQTKGDQNNENNQ
ncbi:MAG: helix-turn-helix transcriptional regulator [Planctomycetota bacterium]|nr:helix-turn-helix transcriptional regulator [Planctomycetota bacterium]